MRASAIVVLVGLIALHEPITLVNGRKPPRSRTAAVPPSRRAGANRAGAAARRPPVSRRRSDEEEDEDEFDDEEDMLGLPPDEAEEEDEDSFEDESDEDFLPPPSRAKRSGGPAATSRTARNAAIHASSAKKRPPPRRRYEDDEDEEDDYDRRPSRASRTSRGPPPSSRRGPPTRRSDGRRGPPRRGDMVAYAPPQPSFLTKSFETFKSSIPDPDAVKTAALSSFKTAREATSSISSNLYRDIKGLTSSELEQVMLKATRPDDVSVKGKHVERLVGVTYQISARYDIYDAVLRKLWAKMVEKDWRTNIKALYILHRFSADGAPDHAPALKARLRELRRTRDPKRKDKYFNSKQLLAGDVAPENVKFRAFMSRYAHYVLLRAQCFGGLFDEISTLPKSDKKAPKPITSTSLRSEHLEAAAMLLKAGVACQLKDGEECEHTAVAAERVAADLIGLTSATAMALNRALKDDDLKGSDPALLKKWCAFYKDELLPQTRAMVKKTSPKLDAYGLYLPSRMGTSVSTDLLEKGLNLESTTAKPEAVSDSAGTKTEGEGKSEAQDETGKGGEEDRAEITAKRDAEERVEDEGDFEDEYEYEEEEYYDDEDY